MTVAKYLLFARRHLRPQIMRTTIAVIAALSLGSAIAAEPSQSGATVSIPRQGPPAEELARMISAGRTFPIDVDELSRLDSVSGSGSTLTYNYAIKDVPETAAGRLKLHQDLQRSLEANPCRTPNFVKLLESGYTLVLNYSLGGPEWDVHVRLLPQHCTNAP